MNGQIVDIRRDFGAKERTISGLLLILAVVAFAVFQMYHIVPPAIAASRLPSDRLILQSYLRALHLSGHLSRRS